MITTIIKSIWFFLPAGFANMSPVIFSRVKFLDVPVDFNNKIRGKAIFGKHKTYRGFFFGILAAIATVIIQSFFYNSMKNYSIVDYSSINLLLLGFLFGFGTMFGDLVESFFKRRLNIKPGRQWIPFDQIDWILGTVIFVGFYININLDIIITALVLGTVLHILVNYLGFYIGIKKNKL